jgi:hypothetical protein
MAEAGWLRGNGKKEFKVPGSRFKVGSTECGNLEL